MIGIMRISHSHSLSITGRHHVQLDIWKLSSCPCSISSVASLLGYLQLVVLGQGILPD